ncbi:MAG: YbaB/EbfC family nucleoid-associated protein [Rhodobacteraceae bacterium]|jgi:DNA-binding YbaB/EbfC family protein|nr:YbaB/EbfC family nucleoid-associated protein [Paracoccaceae bacterium]
MLKGIPGLGGLGDMASMMKKAQQMQTRMAEMQEQLANTVVLGKAGAGLVKASVTAKGEVTGIDIDPSILIASEKEVVEDLILAAIKDAQARGAQHMADEMRKMTEALGLPADMKLPF